MGRIPDNLSLKRKRPDEKSGGGQNLQENERVLYDHIRSKEDMGIWTRDLKKDTNLPDNVFNKGLKSLKDKNLIKDVVHVKNKKKYVIAVEFEPSSELTGGQWYVDGKLDSEFILILKTLCINTVKKKEPITLESLTEDVNRSGALTAQCSTMQISQIVKSLVLENEVMEVKSAGILCYRSIKKGGGVSKVGAMASIPCGVCPHINDCTPDGIISPTTCVYYKKWLTF